MPPEVMDIHDVAAYLRIGYRSVYALAKSGELPGRKVAGRWRFHLHDMEEWLRRRAGDTRGSAPGSGEQDPK